MCFAFPLSYVHLYNNDRIERTVIQNTRYGYTKKFSSDRETENQNDRNLIQENKGIQSI